MLQKTEVLRYVINLYQIIQWFSFVQCDPMQKTTQIVQIAENQIFRYFLTALRFKNSKFSYCTMFQTLKIFKN